MVSSSASEKRRFSDHTNKNNSAVSDALDMEVPAKRRQTIGDMPQQPALKATPSKHRVSLGPVGSYYISGLPKTPRSKKKRPKNDNEELKGYEAVRTEALSICAPPPHSEQLCSNEKESTNEMTGEFSFATSSDSEDAMNKSVLSDPTELTASSFVFASASRQRLQVSSNEVLDGKENTISHVEEKIQVAVDEKKLKDPIPLQSRLSTSPASLRKLTESLKQSRLRSDEERVKRLSYSSSQDTPSVERVFIEVAASEHENHVMNESVESDVSSVKLDVSESSIANLFDGLLDPAPNRQHQSPASETSLLVSPPRKQSFLTNPVSPQTTTSRLQSPGMSPIATDITEEGAIRLTPTKSKLTPTKLKQSPRRVPNHSAVDSPARNTRSASKKAQEAIESEATKKRGSEDKQPSEEQSKRVKETHPEQSHAAPKGILNSAKKKPQAQDSSSRKSVAFGSPEAAEYHVDDPSGTLTPMPAFRAKAMFSIPKESKSEESTSSSEASINQLDAEDTTVDIEVNLNDLIRNTEVLQDYVEGIEDLPGDSTGPNHDDTFETQESTAELEASMNGLIQEVVGKIHQAELPKEEQTTTVELEADMSSLLKAADQETAIGNENSPATSVDMADTESIASVNAPGNDSRNESYEGQELFAGADFQETTEEPSPEEDDTVELETDMSAILAMASQGHDSDGSPPAIKLTDKFPKIKSTLVPATNRMSFGNGGSSRRDIRDFSPATFDFGLSDTPVSTSSLRRRSDGSRRRFSLAKSCRLSMSSDASFLLDATVESVMQAAGNSDAREGQAEQVVTREPFTLTNKEINAMADGLHDKIIDNGFPLAISSLWGPGNVVDSFVSESIQNFAVAVCAEVEEKIMVIPDSVACFEDMLEQIQGARKDLQAWLRNDRNEADIKTIAAVSRTMAENEWSTWEKMVVDSMVSTIDQTLGDLDPESNQLDKYSTFVDDMIECLSFKAGRAAQRARHRTMLRHKSTSSNLTGSIKDLESQVARIQERIAGVEVSLHNTEAAVFLTSERMSSQKSTQLLQNLAESGQRKFASVKGLTGVSPLSVQERGVDLSFIGSSLLSTLSVQFVFSDGGTISCFYLSGASQGLVVRRRAEKFTKNAVTFVKSRCSLLTDALSTKELQTSHEICSMVRQFHWMRGRIEATARELTSLEKRYRLLLENDPEGGASEFLVHVSFDTDKAQSGTLVATFELNASYPFGPLHVSLPPDSIAVDLGLLQRYLMKNAKPGFGYLSRACDVIAAFVN